MIVSVHRYFRNTCAKTHSSTCAELASCRKSAQYMYYVAIWEVYLYNSHLGARCLSTWRQIASSSSEHALTRSDRVFFSGWHFRSCGFVLLWVGENELHFHFCFFLTCCELTLACVIIARNRLVVLVSVLRYCRGI